ncbi:hypothetical protein E8E13_011666 [Curvularia kusanoi]|uniref:Uncharacterized protein n=1 Tax=Curvularia kusanoi TaxID=90978 RepID=A0A9P4WF16_CURKU|nr:hypothetical protein E8E13_011666 [Curvularia kusanoi]
MLLTSTYYPPMPNQHYVTHAPIHSSPLRERSPNAGAGLFDFNMASQNSENQTKQPQRAFKANPLLQTRDAATKRRRDMFFKRVQNNREDKKWESRGDQLQQLDFVSERKRWESKKAQEAPTEDDVDEELLSDATLPSLSSSAPQPELHMTEADYLLAQEEYELQQLIASMEQDQDQDQGSVSQQHFGSDDEDYDQIFMDCATNYDTQHQQQSEFHNSGNRDVDDMDMTDG